MTTNRNGKIKYNRDMEMFVADALIYDSEPIPLIINIMNHRSLGHRNSVTRDFTVEDIMMPLDELAEQGLVELLPGVNPCYQTVAQVTFSTV